MLRILNCFTELVAALDAAIKTEKDKELQEYFKTVRANIALWQAKVDLVCSRVDDKKK